MQGPRPLAAAAGLFLSVALVVSMGVGVGGAGVRLKDHRGGGTEAAATSSAFVFGGTWMRPAVYDTGQIELSRPSSRERREFRVSARAAFEAFTRWGGPVMRGRTHHALVPVVYRANFTNKAQGTVSSTGNKIGPPWKTTTVWLVFYEHVELHLEPHMGSPRTEICNVFGIVSPAGHAESRLTNC